MTEQSKPADKVWAMYDGPNCPDYITRGKWYEVDNDEIGFDYHSDNGDLRYSPWENSIFHLNGDSWKRHVGPTPPHVSPVQADDWTPHDGSQRPKDVGKRDKVVALTPLGYPYGGEAWALDWGNVTRYRVTERAPKKEKRRKVWVFHDTQGNPYATYDANQAERMQRKLLGYDSPIYTAKLTPVEDIDK